LVAFDFWFDFWFAFGFALGSDWQRGVPEWYSHRLLRRAMDWTLPEYADYNYAPCQEHSQSTHATTATVNHDSDSTNTQQSPPATNTAICDATTNADYLHRSTTTSSRSTPQLQQQQQYDYASTDDEVIISNYQLETVSNSPFTNLSFDDPSYLDSLTSSVPSTVTGSVVPVDGFPVTPSSLAPSSSYSLMFSTNFSVVDTHTDLEPALWSSPHHNTEQQQQQQQSLQYSDKTNRHSNNNAALDPTCSTTINTNSNIKMTNTDTDTLEYLSFGNTSTYAPPSTPTKSASSPTQPNRSANSNARSKILAAATTTTATVVNSSVPVYTRDTGFSRSSTDQVVQVLSPNASQSAEFASDRHQRSATIATDAHRSMPQITASLDQQRAASSEHSRGMQLRFAHRQQRV
jgi:hypothetical protein